jgi:hypothetical protein
MVEEMTNRFCTAITANWIHIAFLLFLIFVFSIFNMGLSEITDFEYSQLKNAEAPRTCQRCWIWTAAIRVIDKEDKKVEFICGLCKEEDPKLKHQKIIPKPKKWYQLF